ncbi:PEGA domain-containing protein [Poseidonocella sp. HB161398]|uniref:PEGA domain-containing protein n=1 Tax=Poseidonocella sp. HB161398 TaxID=2320855 RepID=UPI0014867A2E|nr:PEGA domain-containing protein [Poseidonocella sp. HB161398]
MTRGLSDVMVIETEPAGAQVTTSKGHTCSTPCVFSVSRKSEFDVDITLEGYRDVRVHVSPRITSKATAALAGNLYTGLVVGAGIDAGTGAILDLYPNPLRVTMREK